jgi:tRNA threonylcarbamoyladenosine biosynthesis protein TsaE
MTDNTSPAPNTIQVRTESADDTVALAAAIAPLLKPGDLIELEGELGAGKTQFVRGLASGLGLDAKLVSSPTYTISQEYLPKQPGAIVLVHIDAYRLEAMGDVESVGLSEAGPGADEIWAIEWASRAGVLPAKRRLSVSLAHHGESSRSIRIVGNNNWSLVWPELAEALSCLEHETT